MSRPRSPVPLWGRSAVCLSRPVTAAGRPGSLVSGLLPAPASRDAPNTRTAQGCSVPRTHRRPCLQPREFLEPPHGGRPVSHCPSRLASPEPGSTKPQAPSQAQPRGRRSQAPQTLQGRLWSLLCPQDFRGLLSKQDQGAAGTTHRTAPGRADAGRQRASGGGVCPAALRHRAACGDPPSRNVRSRRRPL